MPPAVMRRIELGEAVVAQRQRAAHEAAPAVAAGKILRAPGFARAPPVGSASTVTPSSSSCEPVTVQPKRMVMFGRVRACSSRNASTYIWLARSSGSGIWSVAADCGDRAPLVVLRRHRAGVQAPSRSAGVVAHVGRPLRRQAEGADLRRDAEPPVMLHGARVVRRCPSDGGAPRASLLKTHRAHAVEIEEQRQHQPDRAAADDGDRNVR